MNAQFILASSSPRRKELLEAFGITPVIMPPRVPEDLGPNEAPRALVERLASAKAEEVANRTAQGGPGCIVVAADTAVALGSQVFGKPVDLAEARRMLAELSGRIHKVWTGVSVWTGGGQTLCRTCFSVCSDVTFKVLSSREIDTYVASGEPMDKAGSYAIQGRGAFMIKTVQGSYTNIVGLPMCELVEYLVAEMGWR